MIVTDEELVHLKPWIVAKLEIISDADSDVLADYVVALVRADDPEPQLRPNVITNLEDFLKENTPAFVDELFAAIQSKSYQPGYTPLQTAVTSSPPFSQPTSPIGSFPPNGPLNGTNGLSRKRSYNQSIGSGDGRDPKFGRGERQFKQMRRGSGLGGRGGYQPPQYNGGPSPTQSGVPTLPFPPPPPGMNLDDPMAMMQAMQAIGLPPLPGMPPFPQAGSGSPPPFPAYAGLDSSASSPPGKQKINARCRDYDTKGFCTRGNTCPFQHGNEMVVPDQEYDPKNAVMTDVQMSPSTPRGLNFPLSDSHSNRGSYRGRGRGGSDRGGFAGRRPNRAEFSQAGPNNDRSITSIVVEQIPEDHFSDEAVRAFFCEFGPIEDISMHAYKRLAIVKYSDNASAYRAYNSPKVIFDNRFVKVFWYKPVAKTDDPGSGERKPSSTGSQTSPETPFDKEKFERDAAAAQKKLEEKNALKKDAEGKRLVLEKQKEELLKRQAEEKRKLQEKLAAKGLPSSEADTNGAEHTNDTNGDATATGEAKPKSNTDALKAQLASLEAEAKSMGLDYALSDPEPAYRGRGRGGYRGKGSYRGWEGFNPAYRGSPRGRGGYRGRGVAAGGSHSLDLRPKKVAVKAEGEFDEGKDESLRQFLLGLGEYESIEPSPSSSSTLIVSFKQRFEAEKLFYASKDIPGVGKVEINWFSSAGTPTATPSKLTRTDDDVRMEGADDDRSGTANGVGSKAVEQDFDVAEEDFDVA